MPDFAQLSDPNILASLLALAALEIVLGIDNIVFIAIMVQRVPEASRKLAYRLGLGAALITRLLLLFALKWIVGLTAPLFTILSQEISGRDLVLLLGGAFLIYKSSSEIFSKVEDKDEHGNPANGSSTFGSVIVLFAQSVGDFVNRHPSMQILALSFLLLIGVLLVAEGFDQHVSKGYVYFAMVFSLLVEVFNMRRRAKTQKKKAAELEVKT